MRDPALPLYTIDPDGEGEARSFRLAVPDFNFKSLRVNAVLRYEFRPGSAAYVVWTQRRQDGKNPAIPPSAATSSTSSRARPTTC